MGQVARRFEDLVAWQKARLLAARIYEVTSQGGISRDYGMRDQLRRSAISVVSNIAEGFERSRRAEFHQFLSISKASCAELRSQLYVAADVGYLEHNVFASILAQAEEAARVIGGLRASLHRSKSS